VPEPDDATRPFAYALLRVVPRVERGEQLNLGVVLFCRQLDFLELRAQVDERRLAALAAELDPAAIRARLEALAGIARGDDGSGPIGRLSQSERFGWIVAPASTIIQPSAVHTGLTADPAATLTRLYARLVV
jgi:Protein of unknown function (DUF3037)